LASEGCFEVKAGGLVPLPDSATETSAFAYLKEDQNGFFVATSARH
jgi:hypothetical protein